MMKQLYLTVLMVGVMCVVLLSLGMSEDATAAEVKKPAKVIKVVVWDEQQPRQKQAYSNFLGNEIAEYLKKQKGFEVKSVKLADPEQGLGKDVLDNCDVLVWWGHVKNSSIKPEVGKDIVKRIKAGQLSLIALHSAHWSTPFVEAMYERTRMDARKKFPDPTPKFKVQFEWVYPPARYTTPGKGSRVTPSYYAWKAGRYIGKVRVDMPGCCFPAYRPDGAPSTMQVMKQGHPIVKGVPREFTVKSTEMYGEPFHVPAPDEVIFQETWKKGEWFRSGMVWEIGKGKVFYFRPGHETYPVYKDKWPLKIVENAVRWLGK